MTTKIRYNYPAVRAFVHPLPGDRARLEFVEPQRSVSPGQAAVCYVGDEVLGGGWIERTPAPDDVSAKEISPSSVMTAGRA